MAQLGGFGFRLLRGELSCWGEGGAAATSRPHSGALFPGALHGCPQASLGHQTGISTGSLAWQLASPPPRLPHVVVAGFHRSE